MNKQPDKLFREKLHDFERPVSAGAWDRVAEKVSGKHAIHFWMKTAGTVLVVATAGVLVFFISSQEPPPVALHAPDPSQQAETSPSLPDEDVADGARTKRNATEVKPKTEAPQEPASTPGIGSTAQSLNRTEKASMHEGHHNGVTTEKPNEENRSGYIHQLTEDPQKVLDRSSVALGGEAEEKKHTTIVFTVEEVNEKYLTKSTVAEATPEEDNTSTLKKLLDKAYDLKHNQDPIGDLRQRKNEIFAFNFRGDKQPKN